MGRAVIASAEHREDIVISAKCDRDDRLDAHLGQCDVVIDFSHPDAIEAIAVACVQAKKPLVTGTTGLSVQARARLSEAAGAIGIVAAPNFSVGVNVLFWLAPKANDLLGQSFDVEIIEAHHRQKKDAPSGTAKRLAEILSTSEEELMHGRSGMVGERKAGEIGIHSIRGGDIVGDHTIVFAGAGERLELTHRAASRETFAAGSLRAAVWIIGRAPGLYNMEDVLGLSSS